MASEVILYQDEFSAQVYDYHTRDWQADIQFWLELAQQSGEPALELACGTGRVVLPLARAGVQVTGLDASPYMLGELRRKLAQEERGVRGRVRVVEASMTEFALEERFGLIYVPARSFQALLTRADQRRCLECCARHLRPEGRMAVDVFNPRLDFLIRPGGHDDAPDEFPGPTGLTVRHEAHADYDLVSQTVIGSWRYQWRAPNAEMIGREYALRLHYFFRFELEWMLEACGFEVEALYGYFDRSAFTAESPEMVLVARKKS